MPLKIPHKLEAYATQKSSHPIVTKMFFRLVGVLLQRYRLLFSPEHQPLIAAGVFLIGVFMAGYFFYQAYVSGGITDIDTAAPLSAEFKIDINSAEWPELVPITGIGEKMARAIIAHREQYGPFPTLEAIMDVPGIGESKLEGMKPYLRSIKETSTLPTSAGGLE